MPRPDGIGRAENALFRLFKWFHVPFVIQTAIVVLDFLVVLWLSPKGVK